MLFAAILVTWIPSTFAQKDSLSVKQKLWIAGGGTVVGYTGTLVVLNEAWYKNYPKTRFHFFNDNREWLQMDKVGHMVTSYYYGLLGIEIMDWTGIEHKKAVIIGGLAGTVFQTTLEILDGYSAQWGASWGDLTANTAGTALVISQGLLWDEQRIQLKFSYSPTNYPEIRPGNLGKVWYESILKDYNGQTYWASVNIRSFLSEKSRFPSWLNMAVGYGADGLLDAGSSNWRDQNGVIQTPFPRYRQFYLSPDIDLTRIKTKSKLLRKTLRVLNIVKIPAPALEVTSQGKMHLHLLHF